MRSITLQKVESSDIKTFLLIEQSAAHLKTYAAITTQRAARAELNENIVYFIKKDAIIVGSIGYQMKSKNHAYVSGLVVLPKFQGQGIERAALTKILEKLKTVKRVDLVTHPDNTPAIKLYLSLGFVIEDWKDNYFGDGQPRIILGLTKQEL